MLYSILVSLDVLIAAALIAFVLLQRGAGATAGAAFGGGGGASGTVFGAKGSSSFMSRTTAILAAAFFVNSIVLAYLASHRAETESVMDSSVIQEQPIDIPQVQSDVPIVNIPEGTSTEEMGKIIQEEILKKAAEKNTAAESEAGAMFDETQSTANELLQDSIDDAQQSAQDVIESDVEQALPSDIPQ